MKKIVYVFLFSLVAISCKRKQDNPSMTVTVSYPTVTINGSPYVSINVGGSFTPPSATAYDSFYKESVSAVFDLSTLNNNVPGLYTVVYSAKSHYGFVGTANVYVAVTNVPDALDISGLYYRNDSANRPAYVTKIARGLFMTSNIGGAKPSDATTGPVTSAVFAVLSDTTIDFGSSQLTSDGIVTGVAGAQMLSLAPGDTTLTYQIGSNDFGNTVVRTFVKQ